MGFHRRILSERISWKQFPRQKQIGKFSWKRIDGFLQQGKPWCWSREHSFLRREGSISCAPVDHLGQAFELDSDNAWIEDRLKRARAERLRQEEEIRRRNERDEAACSSLRQAREARDAGDVLKARLLVAKALELRPDDAEATALGRTLDRQQRAAELSSLKTTPLSAGLMQAFSDIESRRAEGDALAAWRLLRDAIEEYGEIDTFTKLRRQIAEEILSAGEETVPEE